MDQEVVAAALHWWTMKRPLAWTAQQHCEHPTVNCTNDGEVRLAKACALFTSAIYG